MSVGFLTFLVSIEIVLEVIVPGPVLRLPARSVKTLFFTDTLPVVVVFAVGVKRTWYCVLLIRVKADNVPPLGVMEACVKVVEASLRVIVKSAVSPLLSSVWPVVVVIVTVGGVMSICMLAVAVTFGLPAPSENALAETVISRVLVTMGDAGV